MNTTTKRWVFTEKELENPSNCSGDDELIATIKVPLTDDVNSDQYQELDVKVTREGVARNYYENGTTGLTPEHRILAEYQHEYTRIDNDDQVIHYDIWKDVEVDEKGGFVRVIN